MARYIKPKFDVNKVGANPFINIDFVIETKKLKASKKYIDVSDISDGIFVGEQLTQEFSYVVEKQAFTKVFIKPEFRLHISAMSEQGRLLYLWIMQELEAGEDLVWVNKKRYIAENMGANAKKLMDATTELLKNRILAATIVPDIYWINPLFFFRGSRVKKYPDNIN